MAGATRALDTICNRSSASKFCARMFFSASVSMASILGRHNQVSGLLTCPAVNSVHKHVAVRPMSGGLAEFFESGRDPKSDAKIVYGRSWRASELRLKSWDDLHKLWYVLLKEKNMLLSQKQMLQSQSLRMPNPERCSKVRKSMCRLKHVLTERATAVEDQRRRNFLRKMINSM